MPATLDATEAEAALDELRRISSRLPELVSGVEAIAQAGDLREARERALTLSGDVPEVRVLGTLDRVTDSERSAMLAASVKGEDARRVVNDVLDRMRATPRVHRALAHVHPYSFAPVGYEAWERYRARLRAMRDEPLWGIPAPHRVPLGAVYIPHRYQVLRATTEGAWEGGGPPGPHLGRTARSEEPVELDPTALLRRSVAEGGLTFVVGGPGSGKSTLARMFAAELADDPLVQPVFIRLRGVHPEADPLAEIARVLPTGEADDDGKALAAVFTRAPKLVLLLDGFDELIQSSRTGLGSFFLRLDLLLRDHRVHAVVCFGRETAFGRDDTAFPSGAEVLRLLPFDDGQVAAWCARWAAATGHRLAWERIRDLAPTRGDDHVEALGALLHEPITLRMLALLGRQGVEVLDAAGGFDLARIYWRVVSEVCERHHRERGDFSPAELRRLLRVMGYAAMQGGRELIHLDDLQRAMSALGAQTDAGRAKSNAMKLIVEISQRTAEGEPQAWEFLHKTLGEYLAAEYLAAEVALLVAEEEDEFGERRPRLSASQLAVRWIERFGPAVVTVGVERFLRRMAGDWKAFFEEGRAREPDRDLLRLGERLGDVYRRLLDEEDAEVGLKVARAWGLRSADVRGVAMANAFLTGGLRLGDEQAFLPEKHAPGRYVDAYHAMRASPAVAHWRRIGRRTGFLGIAAGMELGGFVLSGTRWEDVQVTEVDLSRTSLSGAVMTRAQFVGCNFAAAFLHYSSIEDCEFKKCWMAGASFEFVEWQRARVLQCNLHGSTFDLAVVAMLPASLVTAINNRWGLVLERGGIAARRSFDIPGD